MAFNLKAAVVGWPWYVGTYLAVQFGAANPSLARTITGSVFEAPWLAFWAFAIVLGNWSIARKRKQERIAAKARAETAERAAEQAPQTDTTTTKVRCLHCQHVQTVPQNESTFSCEQCKADI